MLSGRPAMYDQPPSCPDHAADGNMLWCASCGDERRAFYERVTLRVQQAENLRRQAAEILGTPEI